MKKFFLLIILSIFLSTGIYSQEYIEKKIGDETVEFIIPEDYETLKTVYTAIVDMYCDSETSNIEKQKIIDSHSSLTDLLKISVDNLKNKLSVYEESSDAYIKRSTKAKLYLGTGGDFDLSIDGDKIFTIAPQFLIIKPGWGFGLYAPLSFKLEQQNLNVGFDFSVGIGLSVFKRIDY